MKEETRGGARKEEERGGKRTTDVGADMDGERERR